MLQFFQRRKFLIGRDPLFQILSEKIVFYNFPTWATAWVRKNKSGATNEATVWMKETDSVTPVFVHRSSSCFPHLWQPSLSCCTNTGIQINLYITHTHLLYARVSQTPRRFILVRRVCLIVGLLYGYRALTMIITVLPAANPDYLCDPQVSMMNESSWC